MNDTSKKYMHISEIGFLSESDLAKMDSSDPHGPTLQYLGTVTRTQMNINLASIKAQLDAIETLYPREKIATYMTMSQPTRDEFLQRVNPCEIDTTDMPAEQLTALSFSGVQLRVDDTMPDGFIDIYNSNDELIKQCRL